jgi:hypothetical protein
LDLVHVLVRHDHRDIPIKKRRSAPPALTVAHLPVPARINSPAGVQQAVNNRLQRQLLISVDARR